ncbi:MAG: HAD family hydrolase [Candidatus Thorarchaeota archaeon]
MNNTSFEGKKLIVFDLDGTIVKLSADWVALKNILVNKYREIYKEQCNVNTVSKCLDKIVEKNDEDILEKFFDEIRNYEQIFLKETQLKEETIFFIKNKELFDVKSITKFAILSLNARNTIIQSLKLADILDEIDYIIGREDVRKWKPAPEGLIKIKVHFKIKREEMVYFGDLKRDLLTGKNAGIDTYLIDDLINLVNKKKLDEY